MTRTEIVELVAYITAAWARPPVGCENADSFDRTVDVWFDTLAPYDAAAVLDATRRLSRTSEFPPSAADLARTLALPPGGYPDAATIQAIIERSFYGGSPDGFAGDVAREVSSRVGGPVALANIEDPQWARTRVASALRDVVATHRETGQLAIGSSSSGRSGIDGPVRIGTLDAGGDDDA